MHRPVERKLYVLVRSDLTPGLQLAQAVHAATAFALRHSELAASTPNVVVLAVGGEDALYEANTDGTWLGQPGELFIEPDVGDQATAYATVSGGARFSSLPLAGRVPAMT